jgi:hypothetical protein
VVADAGVTERADPVLLGVTGVVHAELVYHFQLAPVPRAPPVTESVVEVPPQMTEEETVAPVGAVDAVFKATATLCADVFPQIPSALT